MSLKNDVLGVCDLVGVPIDASDLEAEPLDEDRDVKPDDLPLLRLLRRYALDARFRVLAGAVDRLPELKGPTLEMRFTLALRASVSCHTDKLVAHLHKELKDASGDRERRLSSGAPSDGRKDGLRYLHEIAIGATLTNGEVTFAHQFDESQALENLTVMGLASEAAPLADEGKGRTSAYRVTERFAVDAVRVVLSGEQAQEDLKEAGQEDDFKVLNRLLAEHGAGSSLKGSVVQRVVLKRLLELGKEHKGRKLSELPFLASAFAEEDGRGVGGGHATQSATAAANLRAQWQDVVLPAEWKPAVATSFKEDGTVGFLDSDDAIGAVYSPEPACRPDGIVMLGDKRALTLGCAVYSGVVPIRKAEGQLRSTDMSRAYFKADEDETYEQAQERRDAWVKAGLDKVPAVRLHVCLPHSKPSVEVEPPFGGARVVGDLCVTIDKTNIRTLLSKPGDEDLLRLLAVATRTKLEDWA